MNRNISIDMMRFSAHSQRKNIKYDATLEPNFPRQELKFIVLHTSCIDTFNSFD